jgi:hypothetical protein
MRPRLWSCEELLEALEAPGEPAVSGELVVVAAPAGAVERARVAAAVERLGSLPCVVVGAPGWPADHAALDVIDTTTAGNDDLDAITATCGHAPIAAAALAVHLRGSARRTVADGLVAESALYSALQAGPEHRAWRAATPVAHDPNAADHDRDRPRVRVERAGAELRIVLTRPERRNALDVAMRDQLLDALAIVEADPELRVVLRGEGPSFCAGGDLDEFGTAPDPASAHLIRLRRSIGAALHRVAARTTVDVHGASAGSGVELAAFAGRVVAAPDATFVLPELALGLIPGAGGTASLPRRIGRHRTAWLALTGRPIDAATALAWGLVDEIALI